MAGSATIKTTDPSVRLVYFVKIALGSQTLRYASEDIVANDTDNVTYFWEGRVADVANLNAGFNDYKSGSATVSSTTVTLTNGKRTANSSNLDSLVASDIWGFRICTIFAVALTGTIGASILRATQNWKVGLQQYAGPGKFMGASGAVQTQDNQLVLGTSDILFAGTISFPNVFQDYSDKNVTFNVFDPRYLDQLLIAPNVIKQGTVLDNSNFITPNPISIGSTIPVIYGDFSEAVQVPAYEVSGYPASFTRILKIADAGSLSAGQYPVTTVTAVQTTNVASVITINSLTLSYGQATITFSGTFPQSTSLTYLVACTGKTRGTPISSLFGGLSTNLLEHPVEVVYDLISNRLATADTYIDTASFTTLYNLDTTLKCRRWIASSETVTMVLNELCFEFGFELTNLFGTYYIKKQSITGTSILSLTETAFDSNTYTLQTDPNRSYFNSITMRYSQNPNSNSFSKVLRIQNDNKVNQFGHTEEYVVNLNWTYKALAITERFSLLLFVISKPLRQLSLTLRSIAWFLKPSDTFDLTFHIFSAQKFLVRNVIKTVKNLSTQVTAWDIGITYFKNWAQDSDTDPASYAAASALTYGIWHADNTITTGYNDTLIFATDGTYTATIAAGSYLTAVLLATAIQTAMNAVSTVKTVTVSYNATTRKFTILRNDSANMTVYWSLTPEIGMSSLGFDTSSDLSGSASYTSGYLAIFDLSDGEAVTQWA